MAPAGRGLRADERKIRLICDRDGPRLRGKLADRRAKESLGARGAGRDFDLSPTSLKSLEPFRDHLTIVSNTDVPSAEPFDAPEIGGDHFRSSAAFLTQAHPKQTEGADVRPASRSIRSTRSDSGRTRRSRRCSCASRSVDQGGGCGYGYSCAYTDTISWASPTQPLPMMRDPRVVFDQLFGVLARSTNRLSERRQQLARTAASSTGCTASTQTPRATLGAGDRVRAWPTTSTTCAKSSVAFRPSRTSTERRAARTAEAPARRAGLVRRPRQADVRPADAGVRVRHHARVCVQAWPRQLEPRLPGKRLRAARSIPTSHHSGKEANESSSSRRSTRITSA